ncbi:MAG TPA: energy transducer TonB [Pyrinomonadaceae bacterium]|nr:energy transducer TonB [Pyrinomonadaceae bacterium]
MKVTTICLIAFSFFISATCWQANAQDNQASSQKPTNTSPTNEEEPKSEVELMLEEAKKRGELIIGTCLEKCPTDADGNTVVESKPLELPQPAYPPLAAAAQASGEVRVQIIVDTDGKVIAASAISGHPLLRATSVKAARGAVFTPLMYEGKPVKLVGVISYRFFRR